MHYPRWGRVSQRTGVMWKGLVLVWHGMRDREGGEISLLLIYMRPAAGLTPLCSATLSLQVQALGEMQLNFSSYHLVKNVCPAYCLTSWGDNKTFYSQSHFFSKFVRIYRIYSKQMKEACFSSLPWTEHSVNQCNCRVFFLRHWTACCLA